MVFDANVLFGFDLAQGIACAPHNLLATMERLGIDRALIASLRCQRGDYILGNRQTLAAVRDHPQRFVGLIAFSATQYLDLEQTLAEHLPQQEFAGIRFFNTDASFMSGWGSSFDSLTMRLALDLLAPTGKLAFLEGGYAFSDIAGLCRRYPQVPFVASGVGYMNLSEAIRAANVCANLCLDIATMDAFEGVRTLCAHCGAHKLVFGTGLPYASPSCAKLLVEKSGISAQEKALVFGGNLTRLIGKEAAQ